MQSSHYQNLYDALDTIQALQQELIETNSGMVALNLELEYYIDDRKRIISLIKENEKRLNKILNFVQAGIVITEINEHKKILFANTMFFEMTGFTQEQAIGNSLNRFMLVGADTLKSKLYADKIDDSEAILFTSEGEEIPILKKETIIAQEGKKVLLNSFIDISDRKKLEEELWALTLNDELTGLFNRRGFYFLSKQALKSAKRMKNKMLLFYFDLDEIKQINDRYGHEKGDEVIIDFANILKKTFREIDIKGRIGGDEFVVLVIGANIRNAIKMIERLYKHIKDENKIKKLVHKEISVSIGLEEYDPEKNYTIENLIKNADKLMYKQKHCKRRYFSDNIKKHK